MEWNEYVLIYLFKMEVWFEMIANKCKKGLIDFAYADYVFRGVDNTTEHL